MTTSIDPPVRIGDVVRLTQPKVPIAWLNASAVRTNGRPSPMQ